MLSSGASHSSTSEVVCVCVFVGQSRSMTQANDFDGARRLGRRSLLFSIMAIAVGLSVVLYLAITGKYTHNHTNNTYYNLLPHISIPLSLSVFSRELTWCNIERLYITDDQLGVACPSEDVNSVLEILKD